MSLSPNETQELQNLLEWQTWSKSPWDFVADCCWTKDEADKGQIKKMPDKEYLRFVTQTWQEESMIAVPKSRRMLMTWLFLCLHLWAPLFNPNSSVFIQSKKQEDSEFLLGDDRMMFIYSWLLEHPDTALHDWPRVEKAIGGKGGKGYSHIRFSNGSYIMAVGQGPDQLRQYTASYVYLTEIAFWEWAEETWGALIPIIQGGGKVAIDSSAGPGFFDRLVHGNI